MADWLSKLSQFVFAYELEMFKEYGVQLKAPRRRCGAEEMYCIGGLWRAGRGRFLGKCCSESSVRRLMTHLIESHACQRLKIKVSHPALC